LKNTLLPRLRISSRKIRFNITEVTLITAYS
jgi:hypothetical protein